MGLGAKCLASNTSKGEIMSVGNLYHVNPTAPFAFTCM